jgi:hypothetical protein
MRFNVLAESIISDMLSEGRMSKVSKYSSIGVDSEKMLEKFKAGDFDIILKSWVGSPRYAGLTEEEIRNILSGVISSITERNPSSFDELSDSIMSVVDNAYQDKGPRRKTYNERLTKAIRNLILHKEYDLIKTGESTSIDDSLESEEESDEQKPTFDIEGLSQIESAVYEFIKQADNPTSISELSETFDDPESVTNSLIQKGLIKREGSNFVTAEDSDMTNILDTDDDFEGNPLEADSDVASTFKDTFGRQGSEEYGDAGDIPSWRRRGRGDYGSEEFDY